VIGYGVSVGILAAVLVVAAYADLRWGTVPNWLTYPAIAAGLVASALVGELEGRAGEAVTYHVFGLAVGFGVLFVAYLLGGMGGGDVKLMAAVGAFLGWPSVLHALVYSFLAAAAVGLIVMIWQGRTRMVLRRLWMAVRILPLPTAKMKDAVPVDTSRVPFGFGACVGVLWFLFMKYADGTLQDALTGGGGLT
jgi:prepilin peptidase CpaA